MIYSARHRQSLFESFLNLLPSLGAVLLGEEADPRCMLLDRARAELGQPAPAPA